MDENKLESLIPNSTQIPNLILDFVLPRVPEAEARVLLYICRRTFGFHKQEDNISFSQFENGIRSRQDKQLDFGTGMSRPAINTSLHNLIKAEAIYVQQNSRGNRYRLNLRMDVDKVVNVVNQLRKLTRNGKAALPKVVNVLNTQKIGNKEKQSPKRILDSPGDNYGEIQKLKSDLCRKLTLKTNQL